MHELVIGAVDITGFGMAEQVHAIQMAAYRQEAEMLGVKSLPPLDRSVTDLQHLGERFIGASVAGQLVAVASLKSSAELEICSFVVLPAWQRRGVGKALLLRLIDEAAGRPIVVTTAARNGPALALYAGHGFSECGRSRVANPVIELVHLRKPGFAEPATARITAATTNS